MYKRQPLIIISPDEQMLRTGGMDSREGSLRQQLQTQNINPLIILADDGRSPPSGGDQEGLTTTTKPYDNSISYNDLVNADKTTQQAAFKAALLSIAKNTENPDSTMQSPIIDSNAKEPGLEGPQS